MKWRWPWQRESVGPVQFGELTWDVHSHVVPGVDDGAVDLDAALTMVRSMSELGYQGMVLTPHVMSDLYPNTPENLQPAFDRLVDAVNNEGIPMQFKLAAEYLLETDFFQALDNDSLLTFPCRDVHGRTRSLVLLEFGFHHAPNKDMVQEAIFQCQNQGHIPVLAHCERYPYCHKDDGLLTMWRDRGGWLSVNAASLVGAYGPETRNMAQRCMERGWVSFLCSDAHGLRHIHALKELQQSSVVAKWMASSSCRHHGLGSRLA